MSISKKEYEELERELKEESLLNNVQIGGDHYKKNKIQTWDFIHENNLGFIQGNIIKHVVRYKDKNGVEDLKKARHYIDKLIEVES